MKKRMLAAYSVVIMCFSLLIVRLSLLSAAEPLAMAQQQQSAAVITVAETRGVIYDRYLRPLTGIMSKNIAAVLPNDRSTDAVMRATEIERRAQLSEMLRSFKPFLWEVESDSIYAKGVEVFKIPQRYMSEQPALHIIGQLDSATGKGASGLEKAY
ncbi:MAG: hypothetical protein J6A76_03790, partial [Oscillospiraceae bacterium]|nr:hypothetical protein [Oscillospiraceae bacterium]